MNLGSLALQLTCNPSNFEAGLLSAEKSIAKYASALGNAREAMSAIAAHPVGAALVGLSAVFNTAKNAAAEFAALNREGQAAASSQLYLQKRLGLSADEAGALSLMTKRLNLDMGDVSGATTAFERHLAQAAAGNTEAAASFQRLGLDAHKLSQMSTTDALFAIGEASKSINSPLERNAALLNAVSRRGAALLPVMAAGSDAFERSARQAKLFGLTFSGAEAQIVKNAKVAQEQAEQTFGLIRQGVANQVAIGWGKAFETSLPALEKAGEGLAKVVKEIGNAVGISGDWKEIVQKVSQGIVELGLDAFTTAINAAAEFGRTLKEAAETAQVIAKYTGLDDAGALAGFWKSSSARKAEADAKAAGQAAAEAYVAGSKAALKRMAVDEGAGIRDLLAATKVAADARQAAADADAPNRTHGQKGDKIGQEPKRHWRFTLPDDSAEDKRMAEAVTANDALVAALVRTGNAEKYLRAEVDAGRLSWGRSEQILDHVAVAQNRIASLSENEIIAKLHKEAAVFGMTAQQAARYKIGLDGVSAAELLRVKGLQDVIDAQTKAAEPTRSLAGQVEQIERIRKSLEGAANATRLFDQAVRGIQLAKMNSFAEAVDKNVEALRFQAATAGLTAQQTEMFRLQEIAGGKVSIDALAAEAAAAEKSARTKAEWADFAAHSAHYVGDPDRARKVAEEAAADAKAAADKFSAAKTVADGLKRVKDAQDDAAAAAIKFANLSPFEKWTRDLEGLTDLMKTGKLSMDEYAKAIGRGSEQWLKNTQSVALPSAAIRGSSEAISAINQAQVAKTDPQEQIKVIAEAQKQLQIQQLEYARRLTDAILRGDVFKKAAV